MNSQQIRSFLSLCGTLNYTRAGQQIHVSQSVVSRHIAQLEGEFGFPLFIRTKHSVSITQAGVIMQQFFLGMNDTLQEAITRAARVALPGPNGISVRLMDMFDNSPIINAMRETPRTEFYMERFSTPTKAEDLLGGSYDMGVAFKDAVADEPELAYKEFFNSQDVLVCSANYSHLHRGMPTLYLVASEMKDPDNITEERAEKLELNLYQLVYLPNLSSVLVAVENGMGYTIMKDFSLPFLGFEHTDTPLDSYQSIGLAWVNDPRRPHIAKFAEMCSPAPAASAE